MSLPIHSQQHTDLFFFHPIKSHGWSVNVNVSSQWRCHDILGSQDLGAVNIFNELSNEVVGWIGQDFLTGANLHNLTVSHNSNTVTDTQGLIEIVRDKDNGTLMLCLQIQQLILHFAADKGI